MGKFCSSCELLLYILLADINYLHSTHIFNQMYTHKYTQTQLLYEFNEMLKQTVSEVIATNWRMVCGKLLKVPDDDLCFHEEYRALQLITKNVYHKKPVIDYHSLLPK